MQENEEEDAASSLSHKICLIPGSWAGSAQLKLQALNVGSQVQHLLLLPDLLILKGHLVGLLLRPPLLSTQTTPSEVNPGPRRPITPRTEPGSLRPERRWRLTLRSSLMACFLALLSSRLSCLLRGCVETRGRSESLILVMRSVCLVVRPRGGRTSSGTPVLADTLMGFG